MGNTAVVSPVAVIGACIMGVAAVASWLSEENDEDRKAITEYREARKREHLDSAGLNTAMSVSMHDAKTQLKSEVLYMKNPDTLMSAAKHLGYQMEPLVDTEKSLKEQPYIFMRKSTGERMALTFDHNKQIVLTTAGENKHIRKLVHQHTLERALDHLQNKGLTVQTATMPTGEVQILAKEKTKNNRREYTEIKAKVRSDGSTLIDVNHLQNNRCHEIVNDFAEAVSGTVTEAKAKTATFKLPGEPAKTKIKA